MSGVEDRRRFEVGQCVGVGGFGEVYQASMVSGGGVRSEVALKVLHSGLDPRSQAIQRLADEAKLLGLLSHPSILRIHDLVLLEGRITLVTEYIAGADLDVCTTVPRDAMPERAVLQVISHVAAALHTAFNTDGPDGAPLHLLHRDIKPSNIRVGRHGEVKLLDFGIAKAAGERTAKTQTNALIGSFSYMAPERLDRDEDDGPASDVFSLGVTLAEAITGKALFDGSIKEIYRVSMDEGRLTEHVTAFLDGAQVAPKVRTLLEEMFAYELALRPPLDTLSERLEDLADDTKGQTLSRWCRKHAWEDGAVIEGDLSGRMITESSLSAEILGRRLVADQPSGMLADRTFEYAIGSDAVPDPGTANVPDAPPFTASVSVDESAAAAAQLVPEPDPLGDADWDSDAYPVPRNNKRWAGLVLVLAVLLTPVAVIGGGAAMVGGLMFLGGAEEGAVTEVPVPHAPVPVEPDPVDPVDREKPGEAPVRRPDPAPSPAPDDGVAEVDPEPKGIDPSAIDRCGTPVGLEPEAMLGRLGPAAACLEEAIADVRMSQVNRDRLGRILIIDAWTRCSEGAGCGDYERVQRLFFEEVTRSDAEMAYAFSAHLADVASTDAQRSEALVWASRAMELKAAWKGPMHIQRVDALHERMARITYATFSTSSENGRARVAARNAAVDWMNHRIKTGGDHAPALALCASVEGSEENCLSRGHDVGARFAITLISRPLGAMVTVDGQQYGKAPQVVELAPGTHEVRMKTDAASSVRTIDADLDEPTRWVWSASDDTWTSHQ